MQFWVSRERRLISYCTDVRLLIPEWVSGNRLLRCVRGTDRYRPITRRALQLVLIILAVWVFGAATASLGFAKNRSAYPAAYEVPQYGQNYREAEHHYEESDHDPLKYTYYWWHWLWNNIIIILIIIVIVYIICYIRCGRTIDREFTAASSSIPSTGNMDVAQVQFLLQTLRKRMPC